MRWHLPCATQRAEGGGLEERYCTTGGGTWFFAVQVYERTSYDTITATTAAPRALLLEATTPPEHHFCPLQKARLMATLSARPAVGVKASQLVAASKRCCAVRASASRQTGACPPRTRPQGNVAGAQS